MLENRRRRLTMIDQMEAGVARLPEILLAAFSRQSDTRSIKRRLSLSIRATCTTTTRVEQSTCADLRSETLIAQLIAIGPLSTPLRGRDELQGMSAIGNAVRSRETARVTANGMDRLLPHLG